MINYKQKIFKKWLGKEVIVKVDRPLGTKHPKYPHTIYSVNYGFIPNTRSIDDQEEIDVYVLGPLEPIKEFKGKVIAIIERQNSEVKLVVADHNFNKGDIERKVNFQEQYFQHKIITQ